MNSFNTGFKYQSRLQGRQIRLLQVKLDLDDQPIHCQISTHSMSENLEYHALSYAWGDCSNPKDIFCNEQRIRVTESLYDALWQLRNRWRKALVWADALCINQQDNIEKSTQVNLMAELYAGAALTIVWLGKEEDYDFLAIELLKEIQQKVPGGPRAIDRTFLESDDIELDWFGLESIHSLKWWYVWKFFKKPWFNRTWVVQESVLSKNLLMLCGRRELDVDMVFKFAKLLVANKNFLSGFDNINQYEEGINEPMMGFRTQSRLRELYDLAKGNVSMIELLPESQGLQATDPRDKYFAYASLVNDVSSQFVDYSKSLSDVSCEIGKMALQTDFGLDWLAFHSNPKVVDLGIPSWVPDFLSPGSPGISLISYRTERLRSTTTPIIEFGDMKEIKIKGKIIDALHYIVGSRFEKIWTPGISPFDIIVDKSIEQQHQLLAAIFLWQRTCKKVAKSFSMIGQKATEAVFEEAFWRALVCNRSNFNQVPGPNIGISYKAWLEAMEIIMEDQPVPFVEPKMEQEGMLAEKLLERMQLEDDGLMPQMKNEIQDPVLRDRDARFQNMKPQIAPFATILSMYLRSRKFFISRRKTIGWAPLNAGGKSEICIFQGCRIPYAIEKVTDQGYHLLGACYLHGFMDGQLWDAPCAEWQMIKLV